MANELTQEELDYLVDFVEGENHDWNKAKDDLKSDMHIDSIRKSFDVGKYCGYSVYKFMQRKMEDDFLSDEEYVKLESKREQEYKERVRLQDANRERRNLLREEGRFENLLELLKDELENLEPISLKEYSKAKGAKEKYATLCLSDWHAGLKVDNQFNYYDKETMIDRVSEIKNKCIKYCQLHGVTNLIVECNGDMMDGGIHVSSRVEQEEGTVQQIVTLADVLCQMINDLKPYFKEIKVVTTLGNHCRMTPNKQDSITRENFETLIPVFIRDRVKDVIVIDSKGLDFAKYNIGDRVICVAHGHNDKLSSVISDFSKLYKLVPDEIHLGHTHGYKDINDCDTIVNVNGSLIGSDEYSLTLRKVTKPSQNLIVYEDDRCIYQLKADI